MKDILIQYLGKEWYGILESEISLHYFNEIFVYLRECKKRGVKIYPDSKDVFRAFLLSSPSKTKVVILGQDPYHNGVADGLAFSTKKKGYIPPSLRNIFKELDIKPKSSNLESWAKQGVLLLNTALTVEKGKALSHKDIGWTRFTSKVIEKLSEDQSNIVFMLWGRKAQEYEKYIFPFAGHLILKAGHPSPLNIANPFVGCGHFDKANEYLKSKNREQIKWRTLK